MQSVFVRLNDRDRNPECVIPRRPTAVLRREPDQRVKRDLIVVRVRRELPNDIAARLCVGLDVEALDERIAELREHAVSIESGGKWHSDEPILSRLDSRA